MSLPTSVLVNFAFSRITPENPPITSGQSLYVSLEVHDRGLRVGRVDARDLVVAGRRAGCPWCRAARAS